MEQMDLFDESPRRRKRRQPQEWKLISLRECPTPEHQLLCDTPAQAARYWRTHIAGHSHFNPDCECFAVLLLTVRRRVRGHHLVTVGLLDTVLIHPREVFRLAVAGAAHGIILMHNHPSGDPTPSEADIRATRELHRAGQFLKIEVLDHVIVGHPNHTSLREMGYIF